MYQLFLFSFHSLSCLYIIYTCSLPDNFYYLDVDSIQLAAWDEENLKWTSQGLQDVSFNLGYCNTLSAMIML